MPRGFIAGSRGKTSMLRGNTHPFHRPPQHALPASLTFENPIPPSIHSTYNVGQYWCPHRRLFTIRIQSSAGEDTGGTPQSTIQNDHAQKQPS